MRLKTTLFNIKNVLLAWPALLIILAFSILFLQRFWFIGKIPWIFFITYIICTIALLKGHLKATSRKFGLFIIVVGLAISSAAVTWQQDTHLYHFTSLIYLIAIYALFTLTPSRNIEYKKPLQYWQYFSLCCAALGIIQFCVYFLLGTILDISIALPHSISTTPAYNIIDTTVGHHIIRANGILFLEPSFFSQFMALALLIEWCFFRRIRFQICFIIALISALSGTGILMLIFASICGVCLYPKALLNRRTGMILITILIMACLITFIPALKDYFLLRIYNIFSLSPHTSFVERFISPWVNLWHVIQHHWHTALFGIGPGWQHLEHLLPTTANYNPLTQLAAYYGLPTVFSFLAFIAYIFLENQYNKPTALITLTVLFQYFFCSGALLTPNIAYIMLWFRFVFFGSSTPYAQRRHP